MTTELNVTIAEHAGGTHRVVMKIADGLRAAAAERGLPNLDEKLYFDVFQTPAPKIRVSATKR